MIAQLIALCLTVLAGGFCLGVLSMRTLKRPEGIDPKVVRDEIEKMLAG